MSFFRAKLLCSIIGKRCKVGRNLGSFLTFAVHSLISCMESLPLSVFFILYIRTLYSASQRFWWMRHWPVQWSLYFLEESHYEKAGYDINLELGRNNAMNTLPEPSYNALLFGFQARERADKSYQVCGSHGVESFAMCLIDLFHPYCGAPLALCRLQRHIRCGLMRVPPSRTET